MFTLFFIFLILQILPLKFSFPSCFFSPNFLSSSKNVPYILFSRPPTPLLGSVIPTFSHKVQKCVFILMLFYFPLQGNTLETYKCGADFLPSPLASKPQFALKAEAVLTMPGLLTAVAVAVENEHTIAFLGNSQGDVFKVELFSFHVSDVLLFIFFPIGTSCCTRERQNGPHGWQCYIFVCFPGTHEHRAICVQQDSWWHPKREGQQEPFLWPQPKSPLHNEREKGVYVSAVVQNHLYLYLFVFSKINDFKRLKKMLSWCATWNLWWY